MKHDLPVEGKFSARDYIGGDCAIDFINTVAGRDQVPRDRLDHYADLLEWARQGRLLPERMLRALARKAQRNGTAAAAALSAAKELRESLFALAAGMAAGKAPSGGSLQLLRRHWLAGCDAHELRSFNGQVSPELREDATDLGVIAAVVAYRMVEHVLKQPMDRLRLCKGHDCAWLFIDSSKAGRRRWCDMAVCGNAAKARRFQARALRRA
jgi:predicted RNA-binding Zn ribbon-like protein